MSNISDLSTAIQNEITANITNPILLAKAKLELADYVNVLTAIQALSTKTMDTYTVAGQSFTFRNLQQLKRYSEQMESNLMRLIYGDSTQQQLILNDYYEQGD